MTFHFLLASETFSTEIANMNMSNVASLVDHQVVGFREGAITPATVECFSDGSNLQKKKKNNTCPKKKIFLTFSDFFLLSIFVSSIFISILMLTANIVERTQLNSENGQMFRHQTFKQEHSKTDELSCCHPGVTR